MIKAVLLEVDTRKVRLFSSTFAVSEVAFTKTERDSGVLDPQIEQTIDELWRPGGPITLVEYHFRIAEKARNLMRQAISSTPQRSLKGKDAVHLASAMQVRADEMHTYDDKLWGYSDMAGFEICAPREQVPTLDTSNLPDPPRTRS